MKLKIILSIGLFSILLNAFDLSYTIASGTKKESFVPINIKRRKVFISKNCNKECHAYKKHNKNRCLGTIVRAMRTSGSFEQICHFNDGSSYLY